MWLIGGGARWLRAVSRLVFSPWFKVVGGMEVPDGACAQIDNIKLLSGPGLVGGSGIAGADGRTDGFFV